MTTGTQEGPSGPLITLFIVMHTFSWICSSIIISTVLASRYVDRLTTWINLNLSWIIACFTFAFLFTTGQLFKVEPVPGVCLVQAAAVTAVPSLTAGTTLALAIQLWLSIHPRTSGHPKRTILARNIALIIIPYVAPLIEFIGAFLYGIEYPEKVVLTSSGMFCGLSNPALKMVSAIFCTTVMVPTVIMEIFITVYVYREWRISPTGPTALTTIIRLAVFTLFGIVGVAASLVSLTGGANEAIANILESLPPVSFVFLFGLQKDLFQVWMSWLRIPPYKRNTSAFTHHETRSISTFISAEPVDSELELSTMPGRNGKGRLMALPMDV